MISEVIEILQYLRMSLKRRIIIRHWEIGKLVHRLRRCRDRGESDAALAIWRVTIFPDATDIVGGLQYDAREAGRLHIFAGKHARQSGADNHDVKFLHHDMGCPVSA